MSSIASGRSSGLHPVSSQGCCMYVRAGRPAFVRPYDRVHWGTSLMSLSLLLQQCPTCLVRLTLIVFVMEVSGRTVGALWGVASKTCSKFARKILVLLPSSFFIWSNWYCWSIFCVLPQYSEVLKMSFLRRLGGFFAFCSSIYNFHARINRSSEIHRDVFQLVTIQDI